MPKTSAVDVDLRGVVLTDSRSGQPHDVGAAQGMQVLTLIRHRY